MNTVIDKKESRSLKALRFEWIVYASTSILFLFGFYSILRKSWDPQSALGWLAVALTISIYQLWYVYHNIKDNRIKEPGSLLFSSFGLANWLTFTRAIFNASLAGFIVGPWPSGWLAWVPSALYLTSAIMDYADGVVARVTGRTTILGESLDMVWDGVGALAAALLLVRYMQVPVVFVVVGLARYLFLLGIWIRTHRGLQIFALPPNMVRRPLAGMLMGFLAVVLMPVFNPPATYVATWLFMVPFLINFFRDWLFVSGTISQAVLRKDFKSPGDWKESIPLVVRASLVILLVVLLTHVLVQKPLPIGVFLVTICAIPALILGAAGRIFALAVLLMTCFSLQRYPMDWLLWAILMLSEIAMMVGTGRFSLWKPEDWLIFKQAGETH